MKKIIYGFLTLVFIGWLISSSPQQIKEDRKRSANYQKELDKARANEPKETSILGEILRVSNQEKKLTKLQKCENSLYFGKGTEKQGIKYYDDKNFISAQKYLRASLSNYMGGFKDCQNTKLEDELTERTARVNKILTNEAFLKMVNTQKFLKN